MFGYLDKLQAESSKLKSEREAQEKRLIAKKKKCDKVKLEIAEAERNLKLNDDT